MSYYLIKDENKETMRKVRYKAEAQAIVALRPGWSYIFVRVKRNIDLSELLKAPF